jgi:3-oxoacyl-[acyl-carrier-protein] synthase-3
VKSQFRITGWGKYLPPRIETAEELSDKINKNSDWIISRAGVSERRVSDVDVDKMGAIAAKDAIGDKPIPDLIINASGVPKQTIPDTSVFIQRELGYQGIPSFSVHSTCLSFITAINVAGSLIQSKAYRNILIVSSDRGTRGRNFNEPESASLLGDAAASVYLEPSADASKGLIDFEMSSWPEGANLTEVRGGGTNLHPQDKETRNEDNLFSMDGPEVFKYSLPKVYDMIITVLKRNKLSQSDIDFLIPHQASGKGVKAYWKFGGFDQSKVMDIINETGNCVAASLPLALVMAYEKKNIKEDDTVFLVGTGAGLSIASAIIKL